MIHQIDIVLPCFNPGIQWLVELEDFYKSTKDIYKLQFIVVNDGTDGNIVAAQTEVLKEKKIPVLLIEYKENRGKGHALRIGVSKSTAPIVIYTDIDFPFTNQSILKLIQSLETDQFDVVVGHRNENYYQKKMSWFRKTLSRTFRVFIRTFLNMQITDTQCGLKGFNLKGKEKFLLTTINRYLFDFEFIYSISNDDTLKIKAVEVQLKENVHFSKMRIRILMQETINLLKVLLKSK